MEIPIFTVDAFTNKPFEGNPAAVCLLQNELTQDLYQKIAAEMNLSETAFLQILNSTDDFHSGSRFGLRWFTPTNEVPLCGHATLASAAVLFYVKKNANATLVFETLSGELYARREGNRIVLDFPIYKPTVQDPNEVKELIEVMKELSFFQEPSASNGLYYIFIPSAAGEVAVQDVRYCAVTKKLLVRLPDTCDRSMLESLKPDPQSLMQNDSTGKVKGLILTLKGNPQGQPGYDFYSRYFAPWNGVSEDPVTGSAHTVLSSYWSEQLGKQKMLAFQCSRRGGELRLSVREDGRVDIAGEAVLVLQGKLTL